jgi:hypothetical protein
VASSHFQWLEAPVVCGNPKTLNGKFHAKTIQKF